ncbi:glucose dehydrogenase [FAD, quinone]-like [Leptopilina heterotoma]|uniref:glucose dehydrogenase [FAD, quinone]-like n=1 Tax=Leptopilina heterotoma TaxID=63436 RepID=UPI001CA811A3|nr:glucose dehydrogenase [FAD, quinone]-like [Leptopilina heterotoma]
MELSSLLRYCSFLIYNLSVYLFVYYLNIYNSWEIYKDWWLNDIKGNDTYDYIVVGAGSAGSVLASKLSEDGDKVLLIEAGGASPSLINVPIISPALQESIYDWRYVTTSQAHACKGLINNQSIWPRGKVFGGTSRLNYMIYARGHPDDFKEWFPDFQEFSLEESEIVSIEDLNWSTKLTEIMLKAVEELGYTVQNINKNSNTGFMKTKVFMKNGERWSSDRVLEKNKNNLFTINYAHVDKILFQSKKAVGVEFLKFGKMYKVFAKKGVILSAGAIGTPKILMLSGVGPKSHLDDLKIDVVSDLPVGQNLMDHIITGLDLVILNSSQPVSIIDVLSPLSAFQYFFHKKGLWSFNGIDVIGTFHSSLQNKSAAPDLELMVMPIGISQDNGFSWRKAMGISDKVFQEYFAPLTYKNVVTLAPVLLHPKSLGEIKLNSKNPRESPIINPKYLSNKEDVEILIEGILFVKQLLETEAMKMLGAHLYRKPFPGCEERTFDSNEYWECYVRHLTLTSYHPAGTSRMGSVVDESFRIYNTSNLFVVDASVFPILPSGNINAAVVMLAEKAAQLFQQRKRKKSNQLFAKCYVRNIFFLRS